MSVYLSFLFGVLTLEMAILFVLVLPLHYRLRKAIVNGYDKFMGNLQVKTVIWIGGALVGLLFVDSWKRAQISVFLHHHKTTTGADPSGSGSVTPVQALAARAYNQRNVYITGFILYFSLCIPTVMSVVRRLVKWEELNRSLAEGKAGSNGENNGEEELASLQKSLMQKKASLEALKKQKTNLEAHFDSNNEPVAATDSSDKKAN
ncbi:LAMI_0D00892g1_1 [Lachancea mirantina]|uniref:Endoplasmic reticulum transmembrane protein n=1 Tax=Lachancea mirantina TaxID=1230905 RepID=A0A1G4J8F6_9SACH|nr:LAMI_0D00892g1_1 [Lachancea mirantina]